MVTVRWKINHVESFVWKPANHYSIAYLSQQVVRALMTFLRSNTDPYEFMDRTAVARMIAKLNPLAPIFKNEKEIANNIDSMDINMIIRLLLLSTIPRTPKINRVPTVKYS